MFGIIKMLFYSFVAVVVGVFIGTVPVGGRTIADRIVSAYQAVPTAQRTAEARPRAEPDRKPAVRAKPAAKAAPRVQARVAAKPVTAGAANSPDRHTDEDRDALERVIASRTAR